MRVKHIYGPVVDGITQVGYFGSKSKAGNPLYRVAVELDCGCILDVVGDFFIAIRHVVCSETCTEKHEMRSLEEKLTPKFLGARTVSKRTVYWEKLINRLLAYGEDLKGKMK